ncbi:hypothetical protein E8F11_28390 [Pseudomonas sp. BN417]|nr:hypothetical protein [Pseudomonas sp. BN417]
MGTFRMEHLEVLRSDLENGRRQYEASLEEQGGQQVDAEDNRERVSDSCVPRDLQLEAGGQSPSSASRREQHFWLPKSGNDFKARFGRYGCVGRARCSGSETHGVGARQLLRRIARL